MSDIFVEAKLLEIKCQDLFSKWFGESSKLMAKAFQDIDTLAQDPNLLVCVC